MWQDLSYALPSAVSLGGVGQAFSYAVPSALSRGEREEGEGSPGEGLLPGFALRQSVMSNFSSQVFDYRRIHGSSMRQPRNLRGEKYAKIVETNCLKFFRINKSVNKTNSKCTQIEAGNSAMRTEQGENNAMHAQGMPAPISPTLVMTSRPPGLERLRPRRGLT